MKLVLLTIAVLCGAEYGGASCIGPEPASQAASQWSRDALRSTGYRDFRAGQYEKALACYQEALQRAQADEPHNTVAVVNDLNDIAILSEEMGHDSEAKTYYARELEALSHLGPAGAAKSGEVFMERAALELAEGSFSAAETDYRKAVAVLTRQSRLEDPRGARALAGLGRLYAEWGKYDEAAAWLERARDRAKKGLSEDSPELITLYDAEAVLLCDAGKFAQAEKRWLQALKAAEKVYGTDGRLYSALLLHLGQLYTQTSDYKTAEATLQQGVAITRKTSGIDGMDRAIMTSALATVYHKEHNYSRAEPLFQELPGLLDHCETVPLACAAVRTDLGDYYMVKSQWQAAEIQYERAFKLREPILGDHPLVASSLISLSRVMRKLKRKKEAKSYQARAEAILALPSNATFFNNDTIDVRSFRTGNQ